MVSIAQHNIFIIRERLFAGEERPQLNIKMHYDKNIEH